MKDPQGENIYCLPVNGDQWCEKMDKPQNKKESVGNTAELSDRKQTRRTSVKQQKYTSNHQNMPFAGKHVLRNCRARYCIETSQRSPGCIQNRMAARQTFEERTPCSTYLHTAWHVDSLLHSRALGLSKSQGQLARFADNAWGPDSCKPNSVAPASSRGQHLVADGPCLGFFIGAEERNWILDGFLMEANKIEPILSYFILCSRSFNLLESLNHRLRLMKSKEGLRRFLTEQWRTRHDLPVRSSGASRSWFLWSLGPRSS